MTRISSAIIGTTLIFSLVGCASTQKAQVESPASTETYPSVQLLSWSDFHSAIYESVKQDGTARGGLPAFMASVEKLRGDGLSMVIDGGDMFQGAMPFNEAKGLGMIEMMNALKIDVSTLGNHEFDYGPGVKYPDSARGALREAIEASHFPWVNANVISKEDNRDPWPFDNLKPYVFIQKGPYKIAVVGVLATETPMATIAANVEGLEFKSPAETLREIIPEIVAQKPDFLIVDAHITGLPVPLPEGGATVTDVPFDGEIGEILALPEEIKKHIDLILAAHSHKSFIAHEGDLTIIENYNGGREITTMTLVGDKDGLHLDRNSIRKHEIVHEPMDVACGEEKKALNPILIGGEMLMPSQTGADIVAKYESQMKENRCDVVGCFSEDVERNYVGECPLGNLVADSMRSYYPQADIALQNAGGIRIDIPKGKLYRENLNSLMPFDNFLYLAEIKGSDIIKTLKISSSTKHGTDQVAGVSYQIEEGCKNPEDLNDDGKIEEWENNCLCDNILIGGQPIDPEKTYKIATSDFLIKGGDDHLAGLGKVNVIEKGPVIKKVMLDYVSKSAACYSKSSLIQPEQPRITLGSCQNKFAK